MGTEYPQVWQGSGCTWGRTGRVGAQSTAASPAWGGAVKLVGIFGGDSGEQGKGGQGQHPAVC